MTKYHTKFPDCLDCVHYHEGNDHICEECEDGEFFEEYTEELDFHEACEA